ncbi:MAG TPA: transcription antitermination factor NusB [Bryobacteraceae bacterium]
MAARHRSRRRALQVLFEWDMRGDSIDRAIQNYYETLYSEDGENTQPLKPDRFMEQLARGTAADVSEIDKQIAAKSEHWRVERMAIVDRNILRLAIYELRLAELPAPVVIDEALELARQFSSDESLAFINGVLDAVHRQANAAGGR